MHKKSMWIQELEMRSETSGDATKLNQRKNDKHLCGSAEEGMLCSSGRV